MIKRRYLMSILIIALGFSFWGTQASAAPAKNVTGVLNINTATAAELAQVPGIGKSKAAAIVDFRKTEKFQSTKDLLKVKGIGNKLLDKMSPHVATSGPNTLKLTSKPRKSIEGLKTSFLKDTNGRHA